MRLDLDQISAAHAHPSTEIYQKHNNTCGCDYIPDQMTDCLAGIEQEKIYCSIKDKSIVFGPISSKISDSWVKDWHDDLKSGANHFVESTNEE